MSYLKILSIEELNPWNTKTVINAAIYKIAINEYLIKENTRNEEEHYIPKKINKCIQKTKKYI